MPVSDKGQLISFAVDQDSDEKFRDYIWVRARKGDTILKIMSRLGHPELAREVATKNHIRHIYTKLHQHRRIRVPKPAIWKDVIHILADDPPPIIKDGYAAYDVIDIPGRKGVNHFKGYNPIAMDVPIQWDHWISDMTPREPDHRHQDRHRIRWGHRVEDEIRRLELMAGRGQHADVVGAPPVIRISVTDNKGNIVPLVPRNYQWSHGNQHAPTWRISAIAWDANPLRFKGGYRVRQRAVVTVTEYTAINVLKPNSLTKRAKLRNTKAPATN